VPFPVDGIVWLLLSLLPLILLQRKVHFEIQACLLLIFRRPDFVSLIFSLLFLPGVIVHELSHYLVARLLAVRTGRFSITPRSLDDGRLQLGYVETAQTDIFRDALIGAAPLIFGGLLVAYLAQARLGLFELVDRLARGEFQAAWVVLQSIPGVPDFWLWFFLLFIISSTMLPSASDRRAWLPILVVLMVLFVLALLAGIGPWLILSIAPVLNSSLRALAFVFAVSAAVHFLLMPPLYLLRSLLTRLTGLRLAA
jgi:hypothetical protein